MDGYRFKTRRSYERRLAELLRERDAYVAEGEAADHVECEYERLLEEYIRFVEEG